MSEEKIRNTKMLHSQSINSESIPSFLLKTYEILENAKYSDIVCWTKNGEGFVVKKVKQFAENILPIHFRHSNYTSFVRQLNMYDFHKTRQQNQENAFKNSMFKRGQKHLLKEIQRKDYKKKKEKSQNVEKTDGTNADNQVKNVKKTEQEKQFYLKGLTTLLKIDQQMSSKQTQLASIDDSTIGNTDQSISEILELIFKVKTLNNQWFSKLSVLGKQWQNMLNTKRTALKYEMESQAAYDTVKKELGPTLPSLQSFSHP